MFNNSVALNAYRYFDIASNAAAKATERIASGQRINRAADGVAEISMAGKLRSQIRGLEIGSRNIQDGLSMAQVMD